MTIYYFPRPPLYTTDANGAAGGVLVELTRTIMARAGITCRFVSMPSKRVLMMLGQGAAGCGVGWLRTRERETFACFSLPIHRDAPLVALLRPDTAQRLPPGPKLESLLSSDLVLGVIDGFSYGAQVDAMIARANPKRQLVAGEVSRLMRMTAAGRCDWMLVNRLEAQWQQDNDPVLSRGLRVVALPDAPPGNLRYLMCSNNTSRAIMERIDQAITLVPGESLARSPVPEPTPPAKQGSP